MQVLEEEEYLRRKEYYQESGQRHYYFMNIGNGEVIDAARKVKPMRELSSGPSWCQTFFIRATCCETLADMHLDGEGCR